MTAKQLLINYLSIPDCIILVDGQMGKYDPDHRIIDTADADWFYLEYTESDKIHLDEFDENSITLNRDESRFQLRNSLEHAGEIVEQNIFITVAVKIAFPDECTLKHIK